MYVYVYVCIYMCIYVYIHMYILVYLYAWVCVYIYKRSFAIYTLRQVCIESVSTPHSDEERVFANVC